MSRAASSLAVTLDDYEDAPPPSRTRGYHLLGHDERRPSATQARDFGLRIANLENEAEIRNPNFEIVYDERDYEAFAVQPPIPHSTIRILQFFRFAIWKRVVVGLAIALLAVALLGLVVSPVLARAASSEGLRVRLSGYSEVQGQVAPQADVPPVVDVSTEPQPAPQPAPPQDQPPPAPAAGSYEVTAPPSLSVQQIERVLQQYRSPATGKGQVIYDMGVRYGIDPAYALAFFVHESSCGTKGVARFTHSLGNIRWTEGFDNYEGYRKYPNWETGIEDWYKLISNLYIGGWGLRTVDAIIPVYAPWGDNNHPPTYIASVKRMVDSWRGK
ncbi:MAG TPA: glucosaminidase domain-containing protein [Chloroflexia bacterium]|nr:glucosaminidase domain-containing protein [Chloroflexia bacterium]